MKDITYILKYYQLVYLQDQELGVIGIILSEDSDSEILPLFSKSWKDDFSGSSPERFYVYLKGDLIHKIYTNKE
jgi:hypothetical protein